MMSLRRKSTLNILKGYYTCLYFFSLNIAKKVPTFIAAQKHGNRTTPSERGYSEHHRLYSTYRIICKKNYKYLNTFCTLLTKESRRESGFSQLPIWSPAPSIRCSPALWIQSTFAVMHLSYGYAAHVIDRQNRPIPFREKRCPDWPEMSREWRNQNRFSQEAHSLWHDGWLWHFARFTPKL